MEMLRVLVIADVGEHEACAMFNRYRVRYLLNDRHEFPQQGLIGVKQ